MARAERAVKPLGQRAKWKLHNLCFKRSLVSRDLLGPALDSRRALVATGPRKKLRPPVMKTALLNGDRAQSEDLSALYALLFSSSAP